MRSRSVLFVSVSAVLLAACTTGSGDIVTEERTVGDFNSIDVGSALNVDLTVDQDAEPSVTVAYDDNVIDRVVTEVRGGTLVVEIDGQVSTFGGGNRVITIVANELVTLDVSGAVDLSGSGDVDDYVLIASGASDVDLRDLTASSVELEVSGASDVRLHASSSVTGEVSGASDVTVYGDPDNIRVDTSGASDFDLAG